MRITGLATGLDMDSLVKETMRPHRIKIQTQQQQREILEMKQKLYRDVINDSREFYNKYFDVSKSDSILLSKNWSTIKFESPDESIVSVSGSSDAKAGNYKIEGSSATAAKATLTDVSDMKTVVVNGKEFELRGTTDKDKAKNLNEDLKKAGFDVTVRYTDFAGDKDENGKPINKSGFIFESTVLGKDSTFTVGGTVVEFEQTATKGSDATKATVTHDDFTLVKLKEAGKIIVGGNEIIIDPNDKDEDVISKLNAELKKLGENEEGVVTFTVSTSKDGKLTFTSDVEGKIDIPSISIGKDVDSAIVGNVTEGANAEKAFTSIDKGLDDIKGKTIYVNGKKVDLSEFENDNTFDIDKLNIKLSSTGVTAEVNADGKVVFTAVEEGSKHSVDISITSGQALETKPGTDAAIKITDSKGGVYYHEGTSNIITLDGVTFKFNGEIPEDGITIKGTQDTKAVKEMVVNFINDYNKLMENLNTLTMTKRDKSYMPLTDEQKESMSEAEIKLWNERVEKGQLSKDSDVTRIANKMKQAMSSLVSGVGGNLEKFGIKPVADYQSTKNGTFTIDETKLDEALENNLEDVMKLFIGTPESGTADNDKYSNTGIAQRLKTILYDETVTVSSPLLKKAGIEGSATSSNNELTRKMEQYDKKIKDMEKDFSRREQALYSKWARVESMMNNLNSQQSYLTSQLGM